MNQRVQPSLGDVRGLQLIALNEETDTFRKQMHAILKSKGFERLHALNRSAMYDWRYVRKTEEISLDGWHGTGKRGTNRWWGDCKTVMCLYHIPDNTKRYQSACVVKIDNFGMAEDDEPVITTADLLKGHTDGVAKMLAFVRELK